MSKVGRSIENKIRAKQAIFVIITIPILRLIGT
jgi:hypothetical protein